MTDHFTTLRSKGLKEFIKFSIVGKPLPNEILRWKKRKKRRIKIGKNENKNFQLFYVK